MYTDAQVLMSSTTSSKVLETLKITSWSNARLRYRVSLPAGNSVNDCW